MNKGRYIGSFDTEDDGAGNPYLWAIVHEKGSWYSFSREKTLEFLLTFARDLNASNLILELWATNLEYDLVNLFGPQRLRELSLTFGKSYLVGASWPAHNVIFRDTIRHIPLGVKDLGELVGLPKLEMKKGESENVAYCVRDATITRRTAKWLDTLYAEFGMAPKQTLASSALTIWKDKYWKREIKLPSKEIVESSKAAYYGGRTEAFAEGNWKNVKVLDVASMFPWAMIVDKFPLPWGPFRRKGKTNAVPIEAGIYEASIKSDLVNPFLPFRTKAGTIYPNGNFVGWYCGHELLYAIERGAQISINKGYEFIEECIPFKGYVNEFFKLKNSARGPARLGYKLLLNSLYGKFGQTGERINAIPLERFVNLTNPPNEFRIWNGIVIYSEKGTPPPWGNNLWSAIITSRARVRLAREIEKIRQAGGTVLYCDTDSIIYQGAEKLKYPEKAEKAGDFELRGEYPLIMIAGKKEYGLQDKTGHWEFHAKGVPEKAREDYLRTGHAEYQKPNKLRESARRDLVANKWEHKTKDRKVSFANRTKAPNGTFNPIVIGA